MTETARFQGTPATYMQSEFAEVFATVHLDGADASALDGLVVSAQTPAAMKVDVAAGQAWVKGMWYQNSAVKAMTIEAADATHPRYDRIVLTNTRTGAMGVALAVVKGTAAASPALPALTQDATTWMIPLATVTVAATVASIEAADVADARLNIAGAMIGVVIDEGGAALSASTSVPKIQLQVPFSGYILGWSIIGDVAGAIVIDVHKSTYAAFPTTSTMCTSAKPTITATNQKATGALAAADWVAITEGDILEFYVDSCTTITRANLNLKMVRIS